MAKRISSGLSRKKEIVVEPPKKIVVKSAKGLPNGDPRDGRILAEESVMKRQSAKKRTLQL